MQGVIARALLWRRTNQRTIKHLKFTWDGLQPGSATFCYHELLLATQPEAKEDCHWDFERGRRQYFWKISRGKSFLTCILQKHCLDGSGSGQILTDCGLAARDGDVQVTFHPNGEGSTVLCILFCLPGSWGKRWFLFIAPKFTEHTQTV